MNKRYEEIRAQLVTELEFNLSIHCKLNARARIRKIADLDYEVKGIDREETMRKFNYHKTEL